MEKCSSFASWAHVWLPVSFTTWTTPAEIRFVDCKLASLSWSLKLFIVFYGIFLLLYHERYLYEEAPGGYPTLWFEEGNLSATQKAGADYCNKEMYNYFYSGGNANYWDDFNIKCARVDMGAMLTKTTKDAFVLTYFKKEHRIKQDCAGSGDACSQITGLKGGRVVTNSSIAGVCSCGKMENYFALGAEDILLYLHLAFHGSGLLDGVHGSTNSAIPDQSIVPVKSCVRKLPTSAECNYDKYHEVPERLWSQCCLRQFEGGEPLVMSIGEWISASGESLDNRQHQGSVEKDRVTGLMPFYRTAGTRLLVQISYFGRVDHQDTIRCNIEVKEVAGWLSEGARQKYIDFTDENRMEYHEDYRRGVSIEFMSSGRLQKLDWGKVVTTLVSCVVFLSVVDGIVGFVAFYLHPRRDVYEKAKWQELHYSKTLAQYGVQIALACHAFGQWDTNCGDGELTVSELAAVFKPYFNDDADLLARTVIHEATSHRDVNTDHLKCEDLVHLLGSGLVTHEALMKHARTEVPGYAEVKLKLSQIVPSDDGSQEIAVPKAEGLHRRVLNAESLGSSKDCASDQFSRTVSDPVLCAAKSQHSRTVSEPVSGSVLS